MDSPRSGPLHRVPKKSAQANFALQLHNFDERTALCLIIHLAKKDPMADEKDPAEMGIMIFFWPAKDFNYVLEPSIIPCKNHLVCHRPLRFEGISSHGFPSAGGAADQHPKAPMDQRRWNGGSVGS
jgi:hypothetical protein